MDFEIDGPELAESGDAWRMMLIHDIYARVATSACRVAWRNPQRSHSVMGGQRARTHISQIEIPSRKY